VTPNLCLCNLAESFAALCMPSTAVVRPAVIDGPGHYKLMGIISHMGSNTACGHYVAHVKKVGGREGYRETGGRAGGRRPACGPCGIQQSLWTVVFVVWFRDSVGSLPLCSQQLPLCSGNGLATVTSSHVADCYAW